MFCTSCGKKIPDGAVFCPDCGARVSSGFAPGQDAAQGNGYAPENGYNVPGGYPGGNGGYQPKKKAAKKFPVWLIATIAGAAVLAVAVLCVSGLGGFFRRTFSSPEKYYQYVENKAVAEYASDIADVYESDIIKALDTENKHSGAEMTLELGDGARNLIATFLGDDLSWLDKVGISTDVNRKGDLSEFTLGLSLGKTQIVSFDFVLDENKMVAYGNVPELSNSSFELDADTLQDLGLIPYYYDEDSVRGVFDEYDKMIEVVPEDDTVEKLLTRYASLALGCIDNVDKGSAEMTAQGVKSKFTTLEVTIDEDTLADIVEAVCSELRNDKDVEKILKDIDQEYGSNSYREFKDGVEDLLEDPDWAVSGLLPNDLVMTLYLNGSGDICGRSLRIDETDISYLKTVSGGKFGFEFIYNDSWTEFMAVGSGKCSGEVYTGEFTLSADGEDYVDFALDRFDLDSFKEGNPNGSIELRPAYGVLGELGLDRSLSGVVNGISLRIDMDVKDGSGNIAFNLSNGGDELLNFSLNTESGSAKAINKMKNGEDVTEWAQDLLYDGGLDKLLDQLDKAGVPSNYLDMLEGVSNFIY